MKHILGANTQSTITGVQKGDAQPNALDLRLAKVLKILPNQFELTNENKVHRGTMELIPDVNDFWYLEPGVYEVVMENIIKVGENEAGFVLSRSTLIRNGCFLIGGLYDSGYEGVMASSMHVMAGPLKIKRGTRIGQFLLFDAEMLHKYDGDYGILKSHDVKYIKR